VASSPKFAITAQLYPYHGIRARRNCGARGQTRVFRTAVLRLGCHPGCMTSGRASLHVSGCAESSNGCGRGQNTSRRALQRSVPVRRQVRGQVGPVSRKKRAPAELPLPSAVADVLKEHRRWLVESQNPGLQEGWVFPSLRGTLKTPGSLTKTWAGCLKAIGEGAVHRSWTTSYLQ
jgi:hypothetical protein